MHDVAGVSLNWHRPAQDDDHWLLLFNDLFAGPSILKLNDGYFEARHALMERFELNEIEI